LFDLLFQISTIAWSDLRIEKELGKGHFGVVHEATWQRQRVAVKQLQVTSPDVFETFAEEVKVMAATCQEERHPNIVGMLSASLDPNNPFVVMEMCSLGSVEDNFNNLTPDDETAIIRGVAEGMKFLHSKNIVHRCDDTYVVTDVSTNSLAEILHVEMFYSKKPRVGH
jgi:serine/threonine protein kinase